jgi:hypothetical protein
MRLIVARRVGAFESKRLQVRTEIRTDHVNQLLLLLTSISIPLLVTTTKRGFVHIYI